MPPGLRPIFTVHPADSHCFIEPASSSCGPAGPDLVEMGMFKGCTVSASLGASVGAGIGCIGAGAGCVGAATEDGGRTGADWIGGGTGSEDAILIGAVIAFGASAGVVAAGFGCSVLATRSLVAR